MSESKKPVAESTRKEKPEEAPTGVQIPAPPEDKKYWWGTGRRKSSVARVRMRPGEGKIVINGREVNEFFKLDKDRNSVFSPLKAASLVGLVDVWANVNGGGHTGQAGAVLLGIARAIRNASPAGEALLRKSHLLTRDSRMKERKKPGQRGARRKFQFSKR